MKKLSHFTENEQGFILPLVLIVSLIIIMLMTTVIKIYQNELKITQNLIEQIEIDTIIQMSFEQVKNDLMNTEQTEGEFVFTLPQQSQAKIQYHFLESDIVNLHYKIKLANEELYEVTQIYSIKDNIIPDE